MLSEGQTSLQKGRRVRPLCSGPNWTPSRTNPQKGEQVWRGLVPWLWSLTGDQTSPQTDNMSDKMRTSPA
jgi:hypothetical protein